MSFGRTRKLDSERTVITKLLRREIKREFATTTGSRSENFIRNYAFASGGGNNFNGNNGADGATENSIVADAYDSSNPGTLSTVERNKLQGGQGVVLQDNPGGNAVKVLSSGINDPMYWLVN